MKAIKLDEIVDSMDIQTDEAGFYLNKETGELIFPTDEDGNNETEKYENNDNYIQLPTKFDINEYDIMEDFCLSIEDDKLRDIFMYSIKGKGAFKRFKDTAYKHEILENWYEFKNIALKHIAIEWCKDNNISYTD